MRRFFLAIAATRVTAPGMLVARELHLVAGEWESPPLIVACRPSLRRRGLRPRAAGRALLMAGSSAHSFGMAEPLRVVGIGAEGRILSSVWLAPSRVVWIRGSRWILELPATHPPPPHGASVRGVASTLA